MSIASVSFLFFCIQSVLILLLDVVMESAGFEHLSEFAVTTKVTRVSTRHKKMPPRNSNNAGFFKDTWSSRGHG